MQDQSAEQGGWLMMNIPTNAHQIWHMEQYIYDNPGK